MEVEVPLAPCIDATQPVRVLLQLVTMVLQHVFLHLHQLVGVAGLRQCLHLVAHNHDGGIGLLGLHRAVGQHLCVGLEVVTAHTCLCHNGIGSAGVLADLLQIFHAQNLSHHIGLDSVLQGVGDVVRVPNHHANGLRSLCLVLEVVDDNTLEVCRHILALHHLTLGRQRSQILLDERTDGCLVVVTNDGKGIGSGIGCALLGNLQDAVVVHLRQVGHVDALEAGVMTGHGGNQRIAEHSLGLQQAVLQRHLNGLHQIVIRLLVLGDIGEVEIHQLQHGLHVLRSRATVHILAVFIQRERCTGNLAGQSLLQLCVRKVTQTAGLDDVTKQLDVGVVLLTIQRRTTEALTAQQHLVLLQVGLLQHDGHTVRQRQLGIAKEVVLHLFLDRALLGQLGHQRLVLHVVHISLNLGCTGCGDGLLHTVLSGIHGTVLLRIEVQHHQIGVGLRNQLLHHHIDSLQGQYGNQLLHRLVGIVDAGDRLLVQEVLHILIHKVAVVELVLVRVLLVEIALIVGLETVVLRRSETELGSTTSLGQGSSQSGLGLSVLGNDIQSEGINGTRQQIRSVLGISLQEGTLGLLGILAQTVVQHADGCILDVVGNHISHRTLQRIGERLVLHHQRNDVVALLLILVDDDNRLVIVRNGFRRNQCTVLRQLNGREEVLDLLFNLVYIHVTDDDDGLIVRTVPLLVVSLQEGTLEVVDNLHQTDRHTIAVLRIRIQLGQVALQHTHLGTGAQAPLLVNHATLFFNLLLLQQQTVGPVEENQQTRVHDTLTRGGDIADVIHRLVDAGIGIQVGTELHAHALTPAQQLVTLEMFRTVKGHMLQEVGQTTLVVVLLNRTHTLSDVELGTLFRPVVVTNVIS